jgi:hypothetical protein
MESYQEAVNQAARHYESTASSPHRQTVSRWPDVESSHDVGIMLAARLNKL